MHNEKLLSAEIRAYKIVIESRGDGTVVLLARRLIGYIHDELKISTHELLGSNGKKDGRITRTNFMKLMVELQYLSQGKKLFKLFSYWTQPKPRKLLFTS